MLIAHIILIMKILLSLIFIFSTLVTFADHHGKKKPLKAFMITGGCCHDYPKQKNIISEGNQRAGAYQMGHLF